VDVYFKSYYFDANGNKLLDLYQKWEDDIWVNDLKVEYIFFENQVSARAWYWHNNQWKERIMDMNMPIIIGGSLVETYWAYILGLYYTDVTGIKENSTVADNNSFNYFPNPATDKLTIEINPEWQADDFQVELYNQSGQRVKSTEFYSNISLVSINVEDMQPGMYLLKVTAGHKSSTQKLIISK